MILDAYIKILGEELKLNEERIASLKDDIELKAEVENRAHKEPISGNQSIPEYR